MNKHKTCDIIKSKNNKMNAVNEANLSHTMRLRTMAVNELRVKNVNKQGRQYCC